MADTMRRAMPDEAIAGGFGTVDEKGRICLNKALRDTLGIEAGSHVAFVALDDAVLIVPQDEHLTALMQRAEDALAAAGRSGQDIIDELPAAREAVVLEAYGVDFVREMQRLHERQVNASQMPE